MSRSRSSSRPWIRHGRSPSSGRRDPSPSRALAVGILAVQVVVRSARWRLLLGRGGDGAELPFGLVLRALLIGYLGNAALPARLGEAARAGVVARAVNRAFGTVLGTVLLERLIDLVALAVLVLVASMFAPVPVPVVNIEAVIIAIAIAGGLVLAVVGAAVALHGQT